MKQVKVTVTVLLTLSPGMKMVERFVDDGEDLGAHLEVDGKLYCPTVEWQRFVRRSAQPAEYQAVGAGYGYEGADEAVYDWFFGGAAPPIINHTIEPIEA